MSTAHESMANPKNFICRQVWFIRQHGWSMFVQKVQTLVGCILAIIPVILSRILRPVILVRFGELNSYRIGHFVSDAEFYLCQKELGLQDGKAIDIFCLGYLVCNRQLLKMCQRALHCTSLFRQAYRVNRLFPGWKKHTVFIQSSNFDGARDTPGFLRRTSAHLKLSQDEIEKGEDALREWGIPPGHRFVCFHARDSAYLSAMQPQWDYSYHNYRDSNIQTYLPAIERLTEKGYYAFRMGAVVNSQIVTSNPRIIDYASKGRTEFLDIFLSAKCDFFVATGSGLDSVPTAFRRPVVYVNFIPMEFAPSWDCRTLFIPKKLWLEQEQRWMKFHEIIASGAGRLSVRKEYEEKKITVVDNSPEEIESVVNEMEERLRGNWKTSAEDDDLQKRYWSLFKSSQLHGELLGRIGADFLRQNRELLD